MMIIIKMKLYETFALKLSNSNIRKNNKTYLSAKILFDFTRFCISIPFFEKNNIVSIFPNEIKSTELMYI